MLPKGLTSIIGKYDEEDRSLYISRADYSSDIFTLDFIVEVQGINDEDSLFQVWTVEAMDHKKSRISFDPASSVNIQTDHPLLWEFTDSQCELYFSGECKAPEKLFYSLYRAHKNLFGKYECFDIAFSEEFNHEKPFQYSNELLVKGSKLLMESYGTCLRNNGLDFKIVGERLPEDENQNLKILFLGETYIIARDFSFKKYEGI